MAAGGHQGHPEREHELFEREQDEEPLPVDLVRQQATDHGKDQGRAKLGEDHHADESARVRQVVGVGAEDDVLHPRADVRREGAQEHDAERPVRQRGPSGATFRSERSVAVDDCVLDLLDGVVGTTRVDGAALAVCGVRPVAGPAAGLERHGSDARGAPT